MFDLPSPKSLEDNQLFFIFHEFAKYDKEYFPKSREYVAEIIKRSYEGRDVESLNEALNSYYAWQEISGVENHVFNATKDVEFSINNLWLNSEFDLAAFLEEGKENPYYKFVVNSYFSVYASMFSFQNHQEFFNQIKEFEPSLPFISRVLAAEGVFKNPTKNDQILRLYLKTNNLQELYNYAHIVDYYQKERWKELSPGEVLRGYATKVLDDFVFRNPREFFQQ